LIVHVDGGSRGNPGPAGAGVTISADDGTLIHEGAYFLGEQTNNGAEYHALIRALQRVQRCGADTVTVFSDSELLVRQITGAYRVKSPSLARLFEQVQLLLLKIPCWNIRHLPREENRRADELVNLAIDRGRDVLVFDAEPAEPGPGAGPAAPPDAAAQPGDGAADATDEMPAAGAAPPEVARAARVTLARAPQPGTCPAEPVLPRMFTVEHALPAGLCIHAAHALIPTILAILNTEPAEFAAIPTLTVRCMNPECRAVFHVSPTHGSNGAAKRDG
jgi:ribonuclease HI